MPEFMAKSLPKAALLLRFLISGGTATVVNLGLLYYFTDVLGVWYLASSVLSFCVAFAVSFTMQKWWTFRDSGTGIVGRQLGLYLGVALANLGANVALMYLFTDILKVWYLLSQTLASALIAIESFLIYRLIIFKQSSAGMVERRDVENL